MPSVKKQKLYDDTGGDKQEMLYDEPSTLESPGALNTVTTVEACDIVEKWVSMHALYVFSVTLN